VIGLLDCAEEHRALLLKWRNSDRVAPYMLDDREIPEDVHDAWFTGLLGCQGRRGWVVTLEGRPVGAAFLAGIQPAHRRAEFGLYLGDESVRGKGVGSGALFLLAEQAFGRVGLHKLCCEALSFNEQALASYRRIGFEEEGVLRDHLFRNGRWVHVHMLAMFEDRWKERRDRLAAELRQRGLLS
jgi:UDP-4-amino-4,6-dideoxy-N-acetyl-beta-L-altrosamine N-acetyltransferase